MPPSRVFATGARRIAGRLLVTGSCTLAAVLFAACQPVVPAQSASPAATPTTTTSAPSPSPTPTVDLTAPGAARRMLDRLLDAAGDGRLIMVELTATTAAVSVLPTGSTEPVTWAYRDNEIQEAASDLQYVDQANFYLDDFDLDDVGRLFRVAASVAEETANQTLQIVDYSGGRVMMAVSTIPESRTVFFHPDGSLLPELDYHTKAGIAAGLADVLEGHVVARQVGVDSETGAWASFIGPNNTTIRWQRPPKVPVTTVTRDDPPPATAFAVAEVDAEVIWRVVQRTIRANDLDADTVWSVTVEVPEQSDAPQLQFQIGASSVTTDTDGRVLPDS